MVWVTAQPLSSHVSLSGSRSIWSFVVLTTELLNIYVFQDCSMSDTFLVTGDTNVKKKLRLALTALEMPPLYQLPWQWGWGGKRRRQGKWWLEPEPQPPSPVLGRSQAVVECVKQPSLLLAGSVLLIHWAASQISSAHWKRPLAVPLLTLQISNASHNAQFQMSSILYFQLNLLKHGPRRNWVFNFFYNFPNNSIQFPSTFPRDMIHLTNYIFYWT